MLQPSFPLSPSPAVPRRAAPEPPPSTRTAYTAPAFSAAPAGAMKSLTPAASLPGPASSATATWPAPSRRSRVTVGASSRALALENRISTPPRVAPSSPAVNSWTRTASDSDRSALSVRSMLLTSVSDRTGAATKTESVASVMTITAAAPAPE